MADVKMTIKEAKEMVKARIVELKAIPRADLTEEQLQECYELEIYSRPKMTTREQVGALVAGLGKFTKDKAEFPSVEEIIAKGNFGDKSEAHVKNQTKSTRAAVVAFVAALNKAGYKISK